MQNKNLAILIITGIVIVVGIMFLLPNKQQEISPNVETVPMVENTTDLDLVESDLDSTDLEQVDTELNEIDSYSSGF